MKAPTGLAVGAFLKLFCHKVLTISKSVLPLIRTLTATLTVMSTAEYAALTPTQAAARNFENNYRKYADSKGFAPNSQSEHWQQSLRRFSCHSVAVQGCVGYNFFLNNNIF